MCSITKTAGNGGNIENGAAPKHCGNNITEDREKWLAKELVLYFRDLLETVDSLTVRLSPRGSRQTNDRPPKQDGVEKLTALNRWVSRSSMSPKRKIEFFETISFARESWLKAKQTIERVRAAQKLTPYINEMVAVGSDLAFANLRLELVEAWSDGSIIQPELPESIRRAISRRN